MAKNMLGMLIGAALDRQDGDSGIKGAVGGYVVEGALKTVVPLAVTFAVGWFVLRGARRGLQAASEALEIRRRRASGLEPQA